jgi:PhnB protein
VKTINPYLIFNGNAEEAFDFYQTVFGGEPEKVRFSDMPGTDKMSDDEKNKLAHVSLPLSGGSQLLMASDATAGHEVEIPANANFYISLEPESKAEAEDVFKKLSEGGHVFMPLEKSDWSELFAMFADKFGIQWMINYGDM